MKRSVGLQQKSDFRAQFTFFFCPHWQTDPLTEIFTSLEPQNSSFVCTETLIDGLKGSKTGKGSVGQSSQLRLTSDLL